MRSIHLERIALALAFALLVVKVHKLAVPSGSRARNERCIYVMRVVCPMLYAIIAPAISILLF